MVVLEVAHLFQEEVEIVIEVQEAVVQVRQAVILQLQIAPQMGQEELALRQL